MSEPTNWEDRRIDSFVELNPREKLPKGTEAPYIEMAALPTDGRWHEEPRQRPFGSGSKFRDGDTLLARITPCLENGKTAQVRGLGDSAVGWGSTEFIVMRAREQHADPDFVYLLAREPAFREYAIQQMTGTSGRQRIPADTIASYEIPLPPLDEQRRIAEVLGALDDRIESCHDIIHLTEKTLLAEFDLLEDVTSDFAQSMKMSEVVNLVGGGTPSTKEERYWAPALHYWVTPRDLSRLTVPIVISSERLLSDEGRDKLTSRLLPAGSVVLSSRAPIGYLAWLAEPAAINQGIIGFTTGGKLSPSFMYAWAKRHMDEIEGRAGGTTFAEISKRSFGEILVHLPADNALNRFSELCKPLVSAMERHTLEIAALHSARDFLLPRLISGELRVEAAEEVVEDVA